MNSSLGHVARIIDAAPPADAPISGWSIDSRTVAEGDLFFALRGPNHDGHAYVQEVMAKGAAGVVVDHPVEVAPALVVSDTLNALQQTATIMHQEWGGEVIGVTGSAGKPTTKDVIAHLLASERKVGKTTGNFNNHVGVPISVLRLPD